MTGQELLEKVKVMTNYTSDYHNEFLSGWIAEAKSILAHSGVSDEAIDGDCSVGVISLIITDLVDNGGAALYDDKSLLNKRISQLALTCPRKEV